MCYVCMYVCYMCCAAAALEPPLFHTEEEEGNINIAAQSVPAGAPVGGPMVS